MTNDTEKTEIDVVKLHDTIKVTEEAAAQALRDPHFAQCSHTAPLRSRLSMALESAAWLVAWVSKNQRKDPAPCAVCGADAADAKPVTPAAPTE